MQMRKGVRKSGHSRIDEKKEKSCLLAGSRAIDIREIFIQQRGKEKWRFRWTRTAVIAPAAPRWKNSQSRAVYTCETFLNFLLPTRRWLIAVGCKVRFFSSERQRGRKRALLEKYPECANDASYDGLSEKEQYSFYFFHGSDDLWLIE